jgi:hypothetical protein
MKLKNIAEVEAFRSAVEKCTGDVWLESADGDRFSLKSTLSQYIALGTLLSESGDRLELFCSNSADQTHFFAFFANNPSVM